MKKYQLVVTIIICLLLFPSSALARSLFEHQNTTVPSNQTVDDIVVIGGDAFIAGKVNNSVVVVNGDVHIQSTAEIKGAVVIIGGQLQQEKGAVVTNDVINISFDNATANSLIIGAGLIVGIGAVKLAASLLMLLLPVLMVVIGKRHTVRFVDRYRTAPQGKLLSMGFFTGLLLVAISVLLILTIVGIPIILLIVLLVLAATVFGVAFVSQFLGEQVQATAGKPEWVRMGVGAFILTSAVNIPFLGLLILLALVLYSLGISTSWVVSIFTKRRRFAK
ncbi:hypothetical protein [Cohnella nanjingensis]|uniref:Polymer-forming cytoskeletal protein n=1 Tax=Cohnella nanjingensis TaxID=1387779 RepID=A0A7X0RL12_9BACL|nr:hypothetical protein [Cohnella nanjingensis]MBB6669306.1 hypothetical protein [Cohnella nanjingensis]